MFVATLAHLIESTLADSSFFCLRLTELSTVEIQKVPAIDSDHFITSLTILEIQR